MFDDVVFYERIEIGLVWFGLVSCEWVMFGLFFPSGVGGREEIGL